MHSSSSSSASSTSSASYRVLARKYRPNRLDDLVGQDVMVRILTNALAKARMAHAFMLSGVRGVGKTSTARIIAKALNCSAPVESRVTGQKIEPCGTCQQCEAAQGGRHLDILELDAASNSGVENMRGLLEKAHYLPQFGKKRVFILDEAHMLSNAAANSLLKVLEEPPAHLIFIFATTEPRKIPLTVTSRCQRFRLHRVENSKLLAHFQRLCEQENVTAETAALGLIVQAADGSVRDGLSLLDQAIVQGDGTVGRAEVEKMLGTGHRLEVFRLLAHAMRGEAAELLTGARGLCAAGENPLNLLQNLLTAVWQITLWKVAPDPEGAAEAVPELESIRKLAAATSLTELNLIWQILFKGLGEVEAASLGPAVLEMVLLRLVYVTELLVLPDLEQLAMNTKLEVPPVSAPPPPPEAVPVRLRRPFRFRLRRRPFRFLPPPPPPPPASPPVSAPPPPVSAAAAGFAPCFCPAATAAATRSGRTGESSRRPLPGGGPHASVLACISGTLGENTHGAFCPAGPPGFSRRVSVRNRAGGTNNAKKENKKRGDLSSCNFFNLFCPSPYEIFRRSFTRFEPRAKPAAASSASRWMDATRW